MPVSLKILSMTNMTTEIALLADEQGLDVLEFDGTSLSFCYPAHLAPGILVSMQCLLVSINKHETLAATGKVIASAPSEDVFRVQIQLRQFDRRVWDRFRKMNRDKQDHADRIFTAIKGRDS